MLADGYGGRMAIADDERLYLASADTLLGIVARADEGHRACSSSGTILACMQLTLALVAGGPERADVGGQISDRRAGRDRFSMSIDGPRSSPGSGRLVRFLRPRDLAADFGSDDD